MVSSTDLHEVESAKSTRKRVARLVKEVARDPAGYTSIICVLLGIAVSAIPMPKGFKDPVDAVAYSVIAAGLFSLVYQFWANGALVDVITDTVVRSGVESARHMAALHSAHWPLKVFPPGAAPNSNFNQLLDSTLSETARYDFRGQSGKHLAARLNRAPARRLRHIRVIIEDSTIEDVMRVRIDEKRRSDPLLRHRSDDDLEAIVRKDMQDSLIGLFLARTNYEEICVAYAPRPTDIRVEILVGQGVFVSPYLRHRPDGFKYPEVFQYDHQSIPAQLWILEFDREFSILGRPGSRARPGLLRLAPTSTVQMLHEHLRAKGWTDSLDELKSKIELARLDLP
ncbi:MAG TPA: hypothetical protein VGL05_34680 [Kribbella sp.]